MRYLWYSMYAFVATLAVYSLFFAPSRPVPVPAQPPVTERPPAPPIDAAKGDVQIALLLDTSSSMDGLIEQARAQLWEIVGELQSDDRDQERTVSVALYQYGGSDGAVRKVCDLTTDLDAVSVKLHSLSTAGGKEHHPRAIAQAVSELDWDDDDKVEKVIVLAGNEGFAQGPVSAETAMSDASNRGIKVITIFCANGGATSSGLASWQRAARLASTELETIDPDKVVAKIETPYDAEIVARYKELEKTRLTYGSAQYQAESANYMVSSSKLVEGRSIAAQADRAVTQSRQAAAADLTRDYGKKVSLDGLDQAQLPGALQGMSKDQQVKEIELRQARRAQLENEIKTLSSKRKAHLETNSLEPAAAPSSLGSSVRQKLRGN